MYLRCIVHPKQGLASTRRCHRVCIGPKSVEGGCILVFWRVSRWICGAMPRRGRSWDLLAPRKRRLRPEPSGPRLGRLARGRIACSGTSWPPHRWTGTVCAVQIESLTALAATVRAVRSCAAIFELVTAIASCPKSNLRTPLRIGHCSLECTVPKRTNMSWITAQNKSVSLFGQTVVGKSRLYYIHTYSALLDCHMPQHFRFMPTACKLTTRHD